MFITLLLIVISVNELQFWKVDFSILVKLFGRTTLFNELHPLKANGSILTTLSGIVTLSIVE